MAYNYRTKALRNANIRKAISLTINRKSLTKNVLKNGAKAPYGIAPEAMSKNIKWEGFRQGRQCKTIR
ncbi:ABC transporter substrate-binding protein [Secundilactobacillus similis]|uniref:ABC transporter substrate-binding protein n=1 Tax=Secundilactobacillus similis TaxID=414682 RepID=UPI0009EC1ACA